MTQRHRAYLVSAGLGLSLLGLTSAWAQTADIRIVNFSFLPKVLNVSAGTTVRWTNEDQASHTVTADHAGFVSGRLAQGQSFAHLFTRPGTYTYHCNIHPYMTGKIIVKK